MIECPSYKKKLTQARFCQDESWAYSFFFFIYLLSVWWEGGYWVGQIQAVFGNVFGMMGDFCDCVTWTRVLGGKGD